MVIGRLAAVNMAATNTTLLLATNSTYRRAHLFSLFDDHTFDLVKLLNNSGFETNICYCWLINSTGWPKKVTHQFTVINYCLYLQGYLLHK